MMLKKYFGTDGIRGRVGEAPITPDFVLRLGWAIGRVLACQSTANKLVFIGKDTRISGYMLESALQAGFINAGVDVGLLGPMPTPAIAYLSQAFRADAGIVISASHNPYYDNGIKLFNHLGRKLSDETELAIEANLEEAMVSSALPGKARRIDDARGRYIEFCKSTLPRHLTLTQYHIVLDCANGATYQIAPDVFRELGAKVTVINASPDGLNINEKCGSTDPVELQKKVKELGANMGIAFDGDGDRVVFVDHNGVLVDGDELLYIISVARHKHKGCSGAVGTLMSNYGLELAFQDLGIPFARAGVGDRYVLEMMQQRGWSLGGEASGHIICGDIVSTGDGIVSSLQVVSALSELELSLAEAKAGMIKFPQVMTNVRLQQKINIAGNPSITKAVKAAEKRLLGKGRVLLRPSGTEPVIRVMVEGEDSTLVNHLSNKLARVVKSTLSA